jgi:hypothetical protein
MILSAIRNAGMYPHYGWLSSSYLQEVLFCLYSLDF